MKKLPPTVHNFKLEKAEMARLREKEARLAAYYRDLRRDDPVAEAHEEVRQEVPEYLLSAWDRPDNG